MNDANSNVRQSGAANGMSGTQNEPELMVVPRPMPSTQASNGLLGIAFTPMQKWEDLYEIDVAFIRGTIFRGLDLPFLGSEGTGNG